jgi:hypothetical protein
MLVVVFVVFVGLDVAMAAFTEVLCASVCGVSPRSDTKIFTFEQNGVVLGHGKTTTFSISGGGLPYHGPW